MTPFIENAKQILEAAENAMISGHGCSPVAILLGTKGGIRIIADSDWPLESLQREYGAQMAYLVSGDLDRVAVEGRNGLRTCHLETAAPARVAHFLLNAAPAYYSFA